MKKDTHGAMCRVNSQATILLSMSQGLVVSSLALSWWCWVVSWCGGQLSVGG